MRLVEAAPPPAPFIAPPEPVVEAPPAVPVKSLADIAALADTHRDKLFKISLKQYVRLVRVEPGRLDVSLTGEAPKTLLGDMTTRLKAWTGRQWIVSLSREEGGETLAEMESAKRDSAITGRQERSGRRGDPVALPRRQDHRRAHSKRAGRAVRRGRSTARSGGRRR